RARLRRGAAPPRVPLMPDFRHRATEPESLDEGVPEEEALKSLRDLRRVNRWLGGRRAIAAACRPLLHEGARLLDVGCGSAALPPRASRRAGAPRGSLRAPT